MVDISIAFVQCLKFKMHCFISLQVTGDCSCLDNVGSAEDNKCRFCTPGYFNLVPNVGCQGRCG